MEPTNYAIVMKELKTKLRKLKVPYSQLAKTLKIPESTLKKWFIAQDGSFNRIQKICTAMGWPLHLILQELSEKQVHTFSFTKEQQTLFQKSAQAFTVYWWLVYERKSSEDIQSLLGLSDSAFTSIILKLDKHKLIQVGADNRIKVPALRPVRWKFEGPFMKPLKAQWLKGIADSIEKQARDTYDNLQFFQLTEQSRDELLKDMQALEEKYARRTILELQGDREQLTQFRYYSSIAQGSYVE